MLSKAKRCVPYLLYPSIILFFYLYIKNIDTSTLEDLSINFAPLIIACLLSLIFRYWGAFVWKSILVELGSKTLPSFVFLAYVYAKSWIARYIPGTVTWLASKVYIGQAAGISKSRLAVSSLIEAGVQIASLASISLLLLAVDGRLADISLGLQLIALAVGLASLFMLLPPVFNRVMAWGMALIKRKPGPETKTNRKAISKSFLLYTIGAFISGASYFFITKSLSPETGLGDFFYIMAAYNLAGVLGMATPFVPSGLGVRDGAQLILLTVIFPAEIALVFTVFSRVWVALNDVLFLCITFFIHKLRNIAQKGVGF